MWSESFLRSGTVVGSCATLARDEFPRPAADRGAQKPVQRLFHALLESRGTQHHAVIQR